MIREKYHINGGSSNEKKNENRSGNS
jgi:hypothetical protein